jgi:hypothetical protein
MNGLKRSNSTRIIGILAVFLLSLTGCKALLPVRSVPAADQAALYKAPTLMPTVPIMTVFPTPQSASTQVVQCTDILQYIAPDLTYPDDTEVKPGEEIDKQWKVKNSGTCNWDSSYTIKLIGGEAMGAATSQALVPARNGTETIISIKFTAPSEPGVYSSEWKAYNADDQAFGDMLYIRIEVTE